MTRNGELISLCYWWQFYVYSMLSWKKPLKVWNGFPSPSDQNPMHAGVFSPCLNPSLSLLTWFSRNLGLLGSSINTSPCNLHIFKRFELVCASLTHPAKGVTVYFVLVYNNIALQRKFYILFVFFLFKIGQKKITKSDHKSVINWTENEYFLLLGC